MKIKDTVHFAVLTWLSILNIPLSITLAQDTPLSVTHNINSF